MNKGCLILIVAFLIFVIVLCIETGEWSLLLYAILGSIFLFFLSSSNDLPKAR